MGRYISGANNISKKLGISSLLSIKLFIPDPKETPIKIWGARPIMDPKK